jgi:hypothetical protein
MPSPIKKKKLDYPEETEGSRVAAETRRRCNKLTAEERREHLRKAMSIVYGGDQTPKTTRARHQSAA